MKTFIAVIAMISCVSGCVTQAPRRPELTNLPPLEKDWSRMIIGSGQMNGGDLKNTDTTGPVYINDKKVGSPAFKEHVVIDLLPSNYEAYWAPDKPFKFYSEKKAITLKAGEVRYFTCDMGVKGAAMAGLVGLLASDYVYKGWLTEKPLDGEGKLVSYYKYEVMNNSVPNPTLTVATPGKPPSGQKDATTVTSDEKSIGNRLDELKGLFQKELITKEEYDLKRKVLIEKL